MESLLRCLRIWIPLARNSFVRSLEFRVEFWGRVFVEMIWVGSQILTYVAAFRHVPHLGGWTPLEMWFFIGTLIFSDGVYTMFVYPNQQQFGVLLRNGQFDFYLLYPLPSLFLAMFRFVNVHAVINITLGAAVLAWAGLNPELDVNWALWLVYMPLGLVTFVGLAVFVTAIGFWTIQNSNLVWFFFELYRLGFRPESFYAGWLRRILLSVFPAAFFFSIPTQIAVGKLGGLWLLYPWLIALALWLAVAGLWRAGRRRYEGALS